MSYSPRLNAIGVVTWRELRSTVYGHGIYVVLTLAFLAAAYDVHNAINGILDGGISVLSNPVDYPLQVATVIAGVYLALCASMSVSRERDLGTMEVLFYGPIDSISYVMAKYLEQMIIFFGSLVIMVSFLLTVASMTNLGVGISFWATAVGSILMVSGLVSFGIFLSALAQRARNSLTAFLLVTAVLLGFDLAASLFSGIANETLSTVMAYIRTAVIYINNVLRYVSPFAYQSWIVRAAKLSSSGGLALRSVLAGILYTGTLLLATIGLLAKRGVKR